jgi:hypothetical protein
LHIKCPRTHNKVRRKQKKLKINDGQATDPGGMAASPPAPPSALKPEIGPDGLARDSPVVAYTEKVRIPRAPSLSPQTGS